nr:MAG TPA: hypothetical protein [Caudoviricetes sp.]
MNSHHTAYAYDVARPVALAVSVQDLTAGRPRLIGEQPPHRLRLRRRPPCRSCRVSPRPHRRTPPPHRP